MFWSLKLNYEVLGVLADSQVPISGMWVSSSHSSKSRVATRWLVHSWNTFGARTKHRQLEHTRLTTAWTWGSHHFPLYSILCSSPWGPYPNGFLSLIIAFWRFKSPYGILTPNMGVHWECECSFPHTFWHYREHVMWLPSLSLSPQPCNPLPWSRAQGEGCDNERR